MSDKLLWHEKEIGWIGPSNYNVNTPPQMVEIALHRVLLDDGIHMDRFYILEKTVIVDDERVVNSDTLFTSREIKDDGKAIRFAIREFDEMLKNHPNLPESER